MINFMGAGDKRALQPSRRHPPLLQAEDCHWAHLPQVTPAPPFAYILYQYCGWKPSFRLLSGAPTAVASPISSSPAHQVKVLFFHYFFKPRPADGDPIRSDYPYLYPLLYCFRLLWVHYRFVFWSFRNKMEVVSFLWLIFVIAASSIVLFMFISEFGFCSRVPHWRLPTSRYLPWCPCRQQKMNLWNLLLHLKRKQSYRSKTPQVVTNYIGVEVVQF